MMTIDYLKESNLKECYEIHDHYYRDWTIGNFEHFDTLQDAENAAKKRMENKEVRQVEIRRFFKNDEGSICYDGSKTWYLVRK